jgi:uncharacterized protein YndB with AHSA1/START domain
MISAMIDVTAARTIPAAPDEIWALLDDPARLGEWLAFAERGELLEGDGVGRRQRMHGRWGRKRSEIDQVVVEHDPPRRLAWRHDAERLDGRPAPRFAASTVFSMTLEPDAAGGTTVRLRSQQVPASALRGLVIRLFGRREVAARLDESLDRLAARFTAPGAAPREAAA